MSPFRALPWILALAPSFAQGQAPGTLPLGTRIRLELDTASTPVVGTLSEVQGDTLFVTTWRGTEGILRQHVRAASVSRGQHRYWLEGAVIGAGAGAVLGTLAQRAFTAGNARGADEPSTYRFARAGAVLLGLVSGIAGYNVRADRWGPATSAMTWAPVGPGLGFRITF